MPWLIASSKPLVDDDEISGGEILAEGTDGGDGEDVGAADAFQGVDVGPVGDGRGIMDVAPSVAGQKGDGEAIQAADQHLVRWLAPGGLDLDPSRAFQPVDLIDPRSSDHAEHGLHEGSLPSAAKRIDGSEGRGKRARHTE